jgi:DNA-binding NarL/FixJ family response regulator
VTEASNLTKRYGSAVAVDALSFDVRAAGAAVAEFADALERVAAGGTALDPEVVGQLLRASRRTERMAALTARERHVLAPMAEGRSDAAIAGALVVSGGTVEKHVASIFDKLGLSRAEAVARRAEPGRWSGTRPGRRGAARGVTIDR